MPEPTPGQRAYAAASYLIAEVAACPCETAPEEVYALCVRCACLASLARAMRTYAKETNDA